MMNGWLKGACNIYKQIMHNSKLSVLAPTNLFGVLFHTNLGMQTRPHNDSAKIKLMNLSAEYNLMEWKINKQAFIE